MKSSASLVEALNATWRALSPGDLPGGAPERIEVVECTGSTNQDLLRDARRCAPSQPRILVALEQTAGRGRCGRPWRAPPRTAVLLSVAVPWRGREVDSAVTLACGIAVVETLRAHNVGATLKWPNDVMLGEWPGEHKLAGLLAEIAVDASQARTLIVGLGLNLVQPSDRPADMPPVAALSEALGPDEVLDAWCVWSARLAAALLHAIDAVAQQGFAPFAPRFDALFAWRGRAVVALDPYQGNTLAQGIARGVDAAGRLLLDVDGAQVTLSSGEIALRCVALEA